MDISLLCINRAKHQITWSGANNQLWYIQCGNLSSNNFSASLSFQTESKHSNKMLNEIKANKQAIGKTYNPSPFSTHVLELKIGDMFYLLTDGFADQFGGPKGKKYKYKALAEKLSSISHLDLTEQKQELQSSFQEWKGELEQVDDVTIIGIRV